MLIRIYIVQKYRRKLGKHCNILNVKCIQFISKQRSNKCLHGPERSIKPRGVRTKIVAMCLSWVKKTPQQRLKRKVYAIAWMKGRAAS